MPLFNNILELVKIRIWMKLEIKLRKIDKKYKNKNRKNARLYDQDDYVIFGEKVLKL